MKKLPPKTIVFFGLVGGLAAGAIAFTLRSLDTSLMTRAQKQDARRVNDLREIILQAAQVHDAEGRMPRTLAEIEGKSRRFTSIADPVTFEIYAYTPLDESRIQVCATFEASTRGRPDAARVNVGGLDHVLDHDAGRTCFTLALSAARAGDQSNTTLGK